MKKLIVSALLLVSLLSIAKITLAYHCDEYGNCELTPYERQLWRRIFR